MDVSQLTVEQLGGIVGLFGPCMDDYLYVYDFKRDYYFISADAMKRFRLPAEQFTDVLENHKHFVYPEDVDMLVEELKLLSTGKKLSHNLHYRWLGRDGKPIWINCRGRVLLDEDGSAHFLVGCINEIGKKQKADNVSGLLGESSMHACFETCAEDIPAGFLLRLGLDDFKDINENHGMDYGDFILQKTAEVITKCILPGQQLFRVVADEFAIVDFFGGTVEDARELYRTIRRELLAFVEENQYQAVYTVSGGIVDNAQMKGYDDAMKFSEFALNEAKKRGKNTYTLFEMDAYLDYMQKRDLNRELYHAALNGFEGFEVYFQPLMNAGEADLHGAETLLRFHREDGTMASPGEFIPILEETGLIIPVGKWVLRQAVIACKEWRRFVPDFRVNVNLSYVQVLKSQVFSDIKNIIEECGATPSSVCIELTESGYLDGNPHFIKLWNSLKDYGVQLALDDFGTGYSNLHCLCDLKPTCVKIDRSFMVKALNREYEHQLLHHIVEMAHSLGLSVCVEGIETTEELARVQDTRPDYIQGYLYGRPCSRGQFQEMFFAS